MNAWMPDDPPFDPHTFSGVGRLFPLPQAVAFPHVVTPLHVFEERYLALAAEALDSDGLITMAVLKPGWEADYAGRPPLSTSACLGKVISHHADDQGRYNLLLLGICRVRLLEELAPPVAFRRSAVELVEEIEPPSGAAELRARLALALERRISAGAAAEELRLALAGAASLGAVADLAAYCLPLSQELKLHLLSEPDAGKRCQLILDVVETTAAELDHLPPFSLN